MNTFRFLIYITLLAGLASCDSTKKSSDDDFSLQIDSENKKIQSGDQISVRIQTENKKIDSITYYYADQFLKTLTSTEKLETQLSLPLGTHPIVAEIHQKGHSIKVQKEIILHSAQKPKIYTYKIIDSHPHDPRAFTQGLEFYKDTLYEGTGQYGLSALRKVDLETGKVLKEIKLDRQYFGEGITVMNDKIYQLTWMEGVGFVYDVNSFEKIHTFKYDQSSEGWGLCNDGKVIYKSDGTNKIWLLDPENLKELSYIEPVTHNSLANQVNEMEYINGKIYANTWQKDGVLIIDPKTGAVDGLIDFRGLKDHLDHPEKGEVFNGIAYNPITDKIYVTGKNWDKIFEVEISEK